MLATRSCCMVQRAAAVCGRPRRLRYASADGAAEVIDGGGGGRRRREVAEGVAASSSACVCEQLPVWLCVGACHSLLVTCDASAGPSITCILPVPITLLAYTRAWLLSFRCACKDRKHIGDVKLVVALLHHHAAIAAYAPA